MTGPDEPGGDEDWGFPEVDPAGPSSTALPEPVDEADLVHDTGSDAWWRAQAQAQRRAAENDPVVPPAVPTEPEPLPPPATVPPEVLTPVDPLDAQWLPPDLPELHTPPVTPEPPAPPVAPEPAISEAVAPPVAPEPPAPPVAPEPVAEEPPGAPEPVVPPPAVPPRAEPPRSTPPAFPRRTAPPPPAPPVVPPPAPVAAPVDETDPLGIPPVPATRAPYDGERVGPARAVAGAAIALVGVLLGIGALFLLGDDEPKGGPTVAAPPTRAATSAAATPSPTQATTPTTQPTSAPTTAAPVTAAPPAAAPVVPVAVLNNSRVKGLAARAADRFRAGGWPVSTQGNYTGRLTTTTVFYAAGQQASAERFARQFGIPRVLPRSAAPGLPVQGMTVVLTRDYRA